MHDQTVLCITVQGEKAATFGSKLHEYRAGYGLVVTVEMPERGTVCAASKEKPYLGLVLKLNLQTLQELAQEMSVEVRTHEKREGAGPFTLELTSQLIDCALRTVRLFDMPDAIPVLYPGIIDILLQRLLIACARVRHNKSDPRVTVCCKSSLHPRPFRSGA